MKIIHLLQLYRLHNCLLAGLGVWLGGYLSGVPGENLYLHLASIAAGLVCAGGNALNDFMDVEPDRINHPNRPLPSGKLPLYSALISHIVLNIFAIAIAVFINRFVFIAVIGAILLLGLYNSGLKKTALAGNILISILGGLTFIVGALVKGISVTFILPGAAVPAVFAFLFHLGREMVKDLADFKGDKMSNYQTFPILLGRAKVLLIITLLFIILIIVTLIPIYYNWYSISYAWVAILLVDLPILATLLYLWLSKSAIRYNVAGSLLKFYMLLGLLAFYLGKK